MHGSFSESPNDAASAHAGSPWFIRYKRNPDAAVRLFCLHCAGGSASEFRGWPAHLSGTFELFAVQLPGREGRVKEPFVTTMAALVDGVVGALTPFLDRPFVIFGHSFGALCGFEVIRELRRRYLCMPLLFVPAGRCPPHLRSKKRPIASLPREAFIEELRKEYGDHIGQVLENAELREIFLPQIHADFALSEGYRFEVAQQLSCPIVAFAGDDEHDLDQADLNAWSTHTTRGFHSRRFPGDHFFLRPSRDAVIEAIGREVVSLRRASASSLRTLTV